MLTNKAGKRLIKYVPDYVLFDLETTGLSCRNDEVIEISALKVKDGSVEDEFSTLVNPGMPIPFMASEVNGITDDMVKSSEMIISIHCYLQDFIFLNFSIILFLILLITII